MRELDVNSKACTASAAFLPYSGRLSKQTLSVSCSDSTSRSLASLHICHWRGDCIPCLHIEKASTLPEPHCSATLLASVASHEDICPDLHPASPSVLISIQLLDSWNRLAAAPLPLLSIVRRSESREKHRGKASFVDSIAASHGPLSFLAIPPSLFDQLSLRG